MTRQTLKIGLMLFAVGMLALWGVPHVYAADQRGITRPQGGKCDIGAVEVVVNTPTPTRTATAPAPTNTPTRTATTPAKTNTPTRTATAPAKTNTPTRTATVPAPTNTPTQTVAACGAKPAKPALIAPANGASTTSKRVTLQWNAAACAQNYQVVVRQDSKNGTQVDSATKTSLSYKTAPLTKGHTYFWFVQACDAQGCAKSAEWKFKVQ